MPAATTPKRSSPIAPGVVRAASSIAWTSDAPARSERAISSRAPGAAWPTRRRRLRSFQKSATAGPPTSTAASRTAAPGPATTPSAAVPRTVPAIHSIHAACRCRARPRCLRPPCGRSRVPERDERSARTRSSIDRTDAGQCGAPRATRMRRSHCPRRRAGRQGRRSPCHRAGRGRLRTTRSPSDTRWVRIAVCALGDLRDRRDSAGAIAPACQVHDDIESGVHLLADRRERQLHIAHEHHGLDAAERVGGSFAWHVDSEPSCPVFMAATCRALRRRGLRRPRCGRAACARRCARARGS